MSASSATSPEKEFFTVIGSNLVRSNDHYNVSVYCRGYENENELRVSIFSKEADEMGRECGKMTKTVTLKGTKNEVLTFQLGDVSNGDFYLKAETTKGNYFCSTRALHSNLATHSVFIQTDKATYKPSDLVQFRVFILDADTKPIAKLPGSVTIFLTDGADNRVKQFIDPEFNIQGVFQGELQLSDSPVLGTWKLHVKIGDSEDVVKNIEVAEYVLPKFEVTIDTTADVSLQDEKIKATVKARYTFEKQAKGTAEVTAECTPVYTSWRPGRRSLTNECKKVSKSVEVDGKKFVEFDMRNELGLQSSERNYTVNLRAVYKDELSGKEGVAEAKVQIHTLPYKLELKQSSTRFKPELPFSVTAVVQAHDKNAPITDQQHPVNFVVHSYYSVLIRAKARENELFNGRRMRAGEEYECWEEQYNEKETAVFPVNGIAKLDISLEKSTSYFHVNASYLKAEQDIFRIEKHESHCNEFIMARLVTEFPKLNETFTVEVLATVELKELFYQVLGRGKLIESQSVQVDGGRSHKITVKSSLSMIPKADFIVSYATADGEIISDRIDVEFGNELANSIDVSLAKDTAKPGEELDISVRTNSNSFVGLLGVDQSVLLLRKGNDVEPSDVFEELKKYGETSRYNYSSYNYDDENFKDFIDSRAVILTNAKKPFQRFESKRMRSGGFGGAYFMSSRKDENFECFANRAAPMPKMLMAESVMADSTDLADLKIQPQKKIEIRKEFPETFIFDSFEFDANTSVKTLTKKVPDTITSWFITGFSIDPATGLGVTRQPTKLNVFQPFFVSTNLPFSIKRGEVVSLPIIVFNYLDSDQQARVTLSNADGEFEFVDASAEAQGHQAEQTKSVTLKANEGTSVAFTIRPLKVGDIAVKVVAESPSAGDGLEKQLKVEPEGITHFRNEAAFVDLREVREFRRTIDIDVPENAVADSTRVEVSIIGDLLGPSIDNLDQLIRMPFGCGEQNMLNFVPNIVVLDYLTTLQKLTPAIEARCKKFMEVGYQRELTYKHDDGSYSAFGKSDRSGSTWLTAFVAKSFARASRYILVDEANVVQALNFLQRVQASDGSFPEVGVICHGDMQGGASKGVALTAYTLIAFLECTKHVETYRSCIERALQFVLKRSADLSDTYSLALAAYALQLAKHDQRAAFIDELDAKAETANGIRYWTKELPKETKTNCCYHSQPNSVNVEMSAYALLAFIADGRVSEAVKIVKWLVSQRNANGGFQSTQDTVVGLQALSSIAMRIFAAENDVEVEVKAQGTSQAIMRLTNENSLVLQTHELSADSRSIEVQARGCGFGLLQVSYRFNIDNSGELKPRFKLQPTVETASSKVFLILCVATSFVADDQVQKSNMAVMEVTLPSGFTFDSDSLEELLSSERVKKVETKNDETVVMIYFDDIDSEELRPTIKAYRVHAVAKQKPSPVIVYDYYDNSRQATAFYSPPEIAVCDIA